MSLVRRLFAGAVLTLCGVALLVRADEEATCSNGRRVRGTLGIGDGGTLRFIPTGQEKPLPADTLDGIRFEQTSPVPPRAGNSLRALLADGQQVTGELLKLDGERVQLRPAWSERVELPRKSVLALTHPPGYRTLFADDLANGAKAWKATGDTLSYDPPTPLDASRFGVTLPEKDKAVPGSGAIEAVFQTEMGPRTLKVTVPAVAESFKVEATGFKGEARDVRRSSGPHRFAVQWTRQSLRITCDDDVLWFNVEQGPGGPLKQVRLTGGAWSAFYLARAVEEVRHSPGDTDQDEAWLASDDQLFGTIHGADSRAVEFEGRFGKKSLPWADLHGVYLRQAKATETKAVPNAVQVRLRTGCGEEVDILDGVLLKLDERQVVFKHIDLGELRLDRKWLREIRPLAAR